MAEVSPIARRGALVKLYAATFPDKPAVIYEDETLTWSRLYERSHALARSMYGLGLRPGRRAAVMIYNLPQFWELRVAFNILGLGSVFIGYRSKAPEIEYIVNNSEVDCVFFHSDFADRILPFKDRYLKIMSDGFICIGETSRGGAQPYRALMENPPDVELENLPEEQGLGMIYTSGTTGKPKGAFRSQPEKVIELMGNVIRQFNYSDEVHLVTCPLYHSAPLLFSGAAFMTGGTVVLMPRFDPYRFVELVWKHGVTSSFVVPTILDSLLEVPESFLKERNPKSLRTLICGAAPLFPRIKLGILSRFGPVLYEFYGSTETGVNTIIRPDEIAEKPASVGRPFPQNELVILDEEGNEVPDGTPGELYIYNPFLMDGYYKNGEATRECRRDKYITVGDVAIRDEEGYYYIVDRKKDMIIRGGVNIYPAEIEDVIHGMEGVRDVAVVGKPDPHWGEIVAAFIVAEPGAKIDDDSIKKYCNEKLSSYKVPEVIVYRDDIPRSPQGKILKRELREELKSDI